MIPLVLAFHTLAAVIWVGGIFFAVHILRPALDHLGDANKLEMWRDCLQHFFHWVWGCVAVLLLTGYGVVYFGYEGFAAVGLHIQIMQITGLIMVGLYVLLWVGPWQHFHHAVDNGNVPAAVKALLQIRHIAKINLILGLFTSAIGATGGFWTY